MATRPIRRTAAVGFSTTSILILQLKRLQNEWHMSPRNFARNFGARGGCVAPRRFVEGARLRCSARRALEDSEISSRPSRSGAAFTSARNPSSLFQRRRASSPTSYRKRFDRLR